MKIKEVVEQLPKSAKDRIKDALDALETGEVLSVEELATRVDLKTESLRENQSKLTAKEYRLTVKKLDKTFFGPPKNIRALKSALGIEA